MTVQLVRPFVWPEEPKDYKEWNMKEVGMGDKETSKWRKTTGPLKDTLVNDERRERMREQAKDLLEGKKTWTPAEERPNVSYTSRQ